MSLLTINSILKVSAVLNKLVVKRSLHDVALRAGNLCLKNYVTKLRAEYQSLNETKTNMLRLNELQPVITLLEKRDVLVGDLMNLNEMINGKDEELKALANDELVVLKNSLETMDEVITEAILPRDAEDDVKGIVLEVNAGVGGQEAMIFAREIFEMYRKFVEFKQWEYELAEYLTTDMGGVRHASMLIEGNEVFRFFKHEAGVHRVQRIPSTEKSGRVHTSTVSVNALPQPDDIQIKIETKDLKIETKKATGAGGQHVNTTDSAVRILHIPTGIAVECQTDRSQIKNRAIALQRIRAILYEKQRNEQQAKLAATKKDQVKSSFRNEKIRTYNFSQDRITDHRLSGINLYNLKTFMNGGEQLLNLILKLDTKYKTELLTTFLENNK